MLDTEKFIAGLHDYMARALRPLGARLDALEQRAGSAEGRTPMFWRGAHDAGEQYQRGDTVQKSGALFIALTATTDTPGASAAWRRISESKP